MKRSNLNKPLHPLVCFNACKIENYMVNYLNFLFGYSKDASESGNERTFSQKLTFS